MADININETNVAYFKIKLIKNGAETISIRKDNLQNTIVDIMPILCDTKFKIIMSFCR